MMVSNCVSPGNAGFPESTVSAMCALPMSATKEFKNTYQKNSQHSSTLRRRPPVRQPPPRDIIAQTRALAAPAAVGTATRLSNMEFNCDSAQHSAGPPIQLDQIELQDASLYGIAGNGEFQAVDVLLGRPDLDRYLKRVTLRERQFDPSREERSVAWTVVRCYPSPV